MSLTFNKKTIKKIEKYIFNSWKEYTKENEQPAPKTLDEAKHNILIIFFRELAGDHFQRFAVPMFELFREWCQGLPSALNCDFCYNVSAVKLFRSWTGQSAKEAQKYGEYKASQKIISLLWRELNRKNDFLSLLIYNFPFRGEDPKKYIFGIK